jgi:hypothetical protein
MISTDDALKVNISRKRVSKQVKMLTTCKLAIENRQGGAIYH